MAEDITKTDDEIIAESGFTAEQVAALEAIVKRTLLTADGGTSVVTVEPVPFGEMRESTPVLTATQVNQAINNETVRAVTKETEVQTRVEEVAVESSNAVAAVKTEVMLSVEERLVEVENKIDSVDASSCSAHTYKGVIDLGESTEANTEEANIQWLNENIVQPKNGHVYVNKRNGMIFCWTEFNGNDASWTPKWVRLPDIVDLTNYYTKDEVYSKGEVDLVKTLAQTGIDNASAANSKAVAVEVALNAAKQAFADAANLVELSEDTNAFSVRTRLNEVIVLLKQANDLLRA